MFVARAATLVTRRPMRPRAPTDALRAPRAPAAARAQLAEAQEGEDLPFAGWHLSSWELRSGVTVVELCAPEGDDERR